MEGGGSWLNLDSRPTLKLGWPGNNYSKQTRFGNSSSTNLQGSECQEVTCPRGGPDQPATQRDSEICLAGGVAKQRTADAAGPAPWRGSSGKPPAARRRIREREGARLCAARARSGAAPHAFPLRPRGDSSSPMIRPHGPGPRGRAGVGRLLVALRETPQALKDGEATDQVPAPHGGVGD